MRILKVADVPRSMASGMSAAMLQVGSALSARGHDVDYLFQDDLVSARCPRRLRRLVVPVVVCAKVRGRHRRIPLDVVEVHEPLSGPYSVLASTSWGRRHLPPCVLMCHGLSELCWRVERTRQAAAGVRTPLWSRLLVQFTLLAQARLGLRRAAHVMVCNRGGRDHLLDTVGLPADRVSFVPNGVDAKRFSGGRRRQAAGLGVLFFGSWVPRKGVLELCEAWARVCAAHPSSSLTVAGTGVPRSVVLEGFPPAVRGSVRVFSQVPAEEVPALLSEHDVLVLPSWYEGMPLVALEAAAAGMAVVGTRIDGTTDIFRDPEPEDDGAILVTPQRPQELAAAIGRLTADAALLRRLQDRARERAAELSWEASAQVAEAAYRRALLSRATVS